MVWIAVNKNGDEKLLSQKEKKAMVAQTSNVETFYIDTGASTLYFQTIENTVTIKDRTITLSRHSFLLFLATAKELGFKTGKI